MHWCARVGSVGGVVVFALPTSHWSRQRIPGFLQGEEREFGMYAMDSKDRFPLLRKVLVALGLSPEAVDDIVERILDWLAEKKSADDSPRSLPFHLRDDFLSRTEFAFCRVLISAVADRFVVCPKVNLADLFFVQSGDARSDRSLLNRIDRKHVDFLLCDHGTLRPRVAIELDDSSHRRPDRRDRDVLVDGVFAAAKLPLVRIPARGAYAVGDVVNALFPYLETVERPPNIGSSTSPDLAKPPAAAPIGFGDSPAPSCPKCGGAMARRTAKTGANAGGSFWGCQNYPRCRGILPTAAAVPTPQPPARDAATERDEANPRSAFTRAWEHLNRPLPESPSQDARYMPKR